MVCRLVARIYQSQHVDFFKLFFTEDSLKIKKAPGTRVQGTFFKDFFDVFFSFILHKLAFHCQIVLTFQVIH